MNNIREMPEAPEVTHISHQMHNAIHGKILHNTEILKGRYITHGPPAHYKDFHKALPLRCESVKNKGKVIFITFEKNWTIIVKLRINGIGYIQQIYLHGNLISKMYYSILVIIIPLNQVLVQIR
jgi:formamidopyrimidine-DNA glycosylase